jgi:long-subunit fatty acid transport protein
VPRGTWGVVVVLAISGFAAWRVTPLRAQSAARSVLFDDFGLTDPLYTSARAAAMGGAFVSCGDDVHAIMYNPAGLARVSRIELGLGLQQEQIEVDNSFFGSSTGVERHSGGFDAVAVAVPVPTFRGNFVPAFGIYRMYTGHMDLHYRGVNDDNRTDDDYFLQQSGSIYGYNLGFGVDLSSTLSGGFAVFLVDGTIDVLEQYDYTTIDEIPERAFYVTNDYSVDMSGVGARIGAQFYIYPSLRGGIALHTPIVLTAKGNSTVERTEHVDNGVGSYSIEQSEVDIDFIVPYRVDVGLSSDWKGLTLALGFGYADWTQASIDRKRLRARNLDQVFKEVIDYRAGLEWTIPDFPARLRAGYARRPYPLKYMLGNRIDATYSFSRASADDQRHQWSVGAGVLVGSVMTLDLAYLHESGTRSLPSLTDDRVTQRFLLSASYRF